MYVFKPLENIYNTKVLFSCILMHHTIDAYRLVKNHREILTFFCHTCDSTRPLILLPFIFETVSKQVAKEVKLTINSRVHLLVYYFVVTEVIVSLTRL